MTKAELLPIGPFRAWVESRLRRRDQSGQLVSAEVLAYRCGVSPARVHRWRYDMTTIPFREVDDALTAEGSTALWELGAFAYDDKGRQVRLIKTTFEMEVYAFMAECGDLEQPEELAEVHDLPSAADAQRGPDEGLEMAA